MGVEFQCPYCHSNNIIKSGKSSIGKQRYRCKNCQNSFITVYNIQSLVRSSLSLTTHISTSFLLLCCLVIE
ncbi:IS1 family transposase [Segatella salivae]|uniref:IS1/IS1595 family N-terminal zinc-binding domain-containing protein n=1 Tax=Segatella salivae TaxID=228604 RepID=UPI001CAB52C5|nr:IS1 family transposase [Segatella salivae]